MVASAVRPASVARGARSSAAPAALAALTALAALLGACRPALVHCTTNAPCGRGACVGGRCEAPGAPPAVAAARRLVLEPVRVGVRTPGLASSDDVPAVVTLGSGSDPAALLLDFDLAPLGALDPASVVEAHVLVSRAQVVDASTEPSVLHVDRIAEPWAGGSGTSRRGPSLRDGGGARHEVQGGFAGAIRLDVRDLVRLRLRGDGGHAGFAVVAQGPGMAVAVSPGAGAPPVLEIYAR